MKNLLFVFLTVLIGNLTVSGQEPNHILINSPNDAEIVLTDEQAHRVVLGGFKIEVNFTIPTESDVSYFFELQISDSAKLRLLRLDNVFRVQRMIKWQPCQDWDSGGCTSWGPNETALGDYDTWDDELLVNPDGSLLTSGKLQFILANNGIKIRVFRDDGVAKCDLSYEGIANTYLHKLLKNAFDNSKKIDISFYSQNQVQLSSLDLELGVSNIIVNDVANPQLNFELLSVNGNSAGRLASDCNCTDSEFENASGESQDLVVFPIPADHQITLQTKFSTLAQSHFTILDVAGKTVHQSIIDIGEGIQTKEIDIDRSSIAPGVYRYRFKTSKQLYTGKIVFK